MGASRTYLLLRRGRLRRGGLGGSLIGNLDVLDVAPLEDDRAVGLVGGRDLGSLLATTLGAERPHCGDETGGNGKGEIGCRDGKKRDDSVQGPRIGRRDAPPVRVSELSWGSRLYRVPSYLISDLDIRVSFLPM